MSLSIPSYSTPLSRTNHSHYHTTKQSSSSRSRSYLLPTPTLLSPWQPSSHNIKGKNREIPPPRKGCSPISKLPDELWLEVLGWLDLDDLLLLREVNRKLSTLALSPTLHHTLTLQTIPSNPLPEILKTHLLPSTKHLHLHPFPFSPRPFYHRFHPHTRNDTKNTSLKRLQTLLDSLPTDQLLTLSLPFSSYLCELDVGAILKRVGGRLEKLELRGSGVWGDEWVHWIGGVGKDGRGLRELDLGFTGITTLPLDSHTTALEPISTMRSSAEDLIPSLIAQPKISPFNSLLSLSIASCPSIPLSTLHKFLRQLPETIEKLDLSHLDQLTYNTLKDLRVVVPSNTPSFDIAPEWEIMEQQEQKSRKTALKEIKLVGIDCLTRRDVRSLKQYWEDQRRACLPSYGDGWDHQESSEMTDVDEGMGLITPDRFGYSTPPSESMAMFASPSSSSSSTSSSPDAALLTPISSPCSNTLYSTSLYGDEETSLYTTPPNKIISLPIPSFTPVPVPGTGRLFEGQRSIREEEVGDRKKKNEEDIGIEVIHSAILESDDEEGYRRFIGEVVGSTLFR